MEVSLVFFKKSFTTDDMVIVIFKYASSGIQ